MVERLLLESLATDDPAAGRPMAQLMAAGGKRIRPALVMLWARTGPAFERDRAARAALAVELVHAATLVHDDVIDRSPTRRGRPTVAAEVGDGPAIVVGDHYFGKAYLEAARTGDAEVVAQLAAAVMTICTAELHQQAMIRRYAPTDDEYMSRIRGKTASLLAAASRVGARLGGVDAEGVTRAGRYGEKLGLAFQVSDDVLDYVGTEAEIGKPVGHDLAEGHATLPLMLARRAGLGAAERHLVDGQPLDATAVAEVVAGVRASRAPTAALERARALASEAVAELDPLPPSGPVEALRNLADFVVARRL